MLHRLRKVVTAVTPFRLRYWLVYHNSYDGLLVVRQRRYPGNEAYSSRCGMITLDGPFDSTDEAARSLAFWILQYGDKAKRPKVRNQSLYPDNVDSSLN